MSHVLGARTQLQHRQKLGAWIDDQPEPEHLLRTPQPRAQLIQLQVWEMEVAEEVYVQGLCMRASASEPGGDSGLTIAEDPFGSGRVEPFGQCRQHHGDLVRWSFQPVQRGVTPSIEGGAASLTAKGLDALGMTMLAIADQRVDLRIGVAEVPALRVGTSEPFGLYAFGGSSPAFPLAPGSHRSRPWLCTRRDSGAESTGGTIVWAAGLQQTVKRRALGSSS